MDPVKYFAERKCKKYNNLSVILYLVIASHYDIHIV